MERDHLATSTPIIDISLSQGQLTLLLWISRECHTINGTVTDDWFYLWLNLKDDYKVSNTRNKFIAIGCDTQATLMDSSGKNFQTGCISYCTDVNSVINGSCTGIGCCETAIPKGVNSLNISFDSYYSHSKSWNFSRCSYAFLADVQWFKFYVSDLLDFPNRVEYKHFFQDRGQNLPATPVVVDWGIGNLTCQEALQPNQKQYACGRNTNCSDSENAPGYHCLCKQGFEGNPYLLDGCKDVDECADPEKNSCVAICENTEGSFNCSCPSGYYGNGVNATKGGSGCTPFKKDFPLTQLILGTSFGVLLILIGSSVVFWALQKRKLMKSREKFFQQNGGMFLRQQLSSHDRLVDTIKIFTSEELKKATDNYDERRILGRGGYGTVYKGVLSDDRVVAIKKSKVIDKAQIEQFINEVIILSQINHRNVVKLLGCCLETEVPLLVYEYITNGTLHHHIHDSQNHKHSFSWGKRLRIASETAGALAYLHSAASQPIIHRDVKSTNILLDENYTAKVADFGASRLVAFDQTQLSTLVQGTMGYLDPEYLHTSVLTDKSDVYSFGVVLVELLTARKVLSLKQPEEQRNLAMYFVSSMKENCLMELLDQRIVQEEDLEDIHEVATLARRCLRLNGEDRPTMKEVAMELEGLRVSKKHAWMEQDHEETTHLLGEMPLPAHETNPSNTSFNQVTMSILDAGR
ncbi:hypothetical protein Scep_002413 [Stephania cephalantha]|uniref:Uncharacterized protein n=1 Tax=Stephania cephalantha TaxID=152367 RepID=A0AAP0LBD8_9MAGN